LTPAFEAKEADTYKDPGRERGREERKRFDE